MAVIVLQHGPADTPGRLGATFRDHGLKLDVRRLDLPHDHALNRRGHLPPDLDDVHAVVTLGGPQRALERTPWMDAETTFLKAAHERELPVIGIGLGAQLLAQALGGEIAPAERVQAGFVQVTINPSGQTETLLSGIPWTSRQFHAHSDQIATPPPGSTVLASSADCPVEVFRAGLRTIGFQFHPEVDAAGIRAIAASHAATFARAGLTADLLRSQVADHYDGFARLGDRLCVNLVAYLFPLERVLV